jgi:O-antigen/teichoic acid export membrane protein
VPYSRALGSFLGGTESAPLPRTRTVAIVATTLASILSRVSSLASQVIVGIFLTDAEVGEWAVAIGIIGITGIWRNGGSATYFPSVKPERFDFMSGPLFAWAVMFGGATALATGVVVLSIPMLPSEFDSYREPSLTLILLLLAARSVIHPLALLGRMRLLVSHQFTSVARLDALLAVLRVGITWIVAREGGGALALAIPYVAATALEAICLAFMGGFIRSDFDLRTWKLGGLGTLLAWPLAMAVLGSIRGEAAFLLVGLAIPSAALGIFYFAFQLANQPTMMIGGALQNILAPMVARDRGSAEAERAGIERVLASSMLFVPITTMAAASFFPTAEHLLWNGKWASASASLYWLCAAATYTTVAALLVGPLVGLQRFKAAAGFEFLKMVGMMLGVLAGALLIRASDGREIFGMSALTAVSACVSVGMAGSALAQILWVARAYHLGKADTVRHLCFGPALSALTAIAATSIASSLNTSLGITHDRPGAAWELLTVSLTYVALIVLAVRFTAEGTLRDTLMTLPRPVSDPLRRILLLT